jgi:hypothetical protein
MRVVGCVWMRVDACGCVWMRVDACGCVWMRVDACGCVWMRVCGCISAECQGITGYCLHSRTLQRARCGPQVEDPPLCECDWSTPRLAPLRDAMRDPALYMEALAALEKLCSHKHGENETHPAYIARCASLAAAVDWIAFVLHVAGQDADVAHIAYRVLASAAFGTGKLGESKQSLLRAVAPVVATMQTHQGDAAVVRKAARFFQNMSVEAVIRSKLCELGVLDAVLKAGKRHPEDAVIQAHLGICVKCLAE